MTEDEDDTVYLEALDAAERLAAVDTCVQAHLAADDLQAGPGELDEDEEWVIYRGQARSTTQRPWTLRCVVDSDEDLKFDFGEVQLHVEVDNRLGHLVIVGDEKEKAEPELVEMLDRAGDEFSRLAYRMLEQHQLYRVKVRHEALVVTIADLGCGVDDWRDEPYSVGGLLDFLEPMAALLEKLAMDGFTVCRFCSARINVQAASSCNNCGAAL